MDKLVSFRTKNFMTVEITVGNEVIIEKFGKTFDKITISSNY